MKLFEIFQKLGIEDIIISDTFLIRSWMANQTGSPGD